MKTIIIDTDIDTDCDDAAAIGLAHQFARAGHCAIAGIICSVPVPECVGTVQAINQAWSCDIPVGLVTVPDRAGDPVWQDYDRHRTRIASGELGFFAYHDAVGRTDLSAPADANRYSASVPDAVSLYRRLLGRADSLSVTICAIGTHTALAQLLASGPDEHSSLSGAELVARTTRELVTMADGWYPAGRDVFNWRTDPVSAAAVLSEWPSPITVSPCGTAVLTGTRIMRDLPKSHPVRAAYETFLGSPQRQRPSWDLVAVAWAVLGLTGPFALSADRSIEFDATTGEHRWLTKPGAWPRRIVMPTMRDEPMAAWLEGLIVGA